MVQVKYSKKGPATEDRSKGMCKSHYCCGATPSNLKKECSTRNTEFYKCGKRNTSRVVAGQRRKRRNRAE